MERVTLEWPSIGHLLEAAAARNPSRRLLVVDGESITYAAGDARVNRIANVLRAQGLKKGDRVGVMLPNCVDFPLIWLALAKCGLILVPTNAEYQEKDLAYVLGDSGAAAMIVHADFLPRLQAVRSALPTLATVLIAGRPEAGLPSFEGLVGSASDRFAIGDVGQDDLINIQYTSGTTGFPKGCMLTHRYWMLIAHYGRRCLELHDDDVNFNAQPFYYMDGMWNLTLCLMAGIPLVLTKRFSVSQFWRTVVENDVTFFYCLGTMPIMLMNREPDEYERRHKVRAVYCSGIVPQMHAQFEQRFRCPWRECYGTTESGTETLVLFAERETVGTGSLGRTIPSKESRIVDNAGGELPPGQVGEYISCGEPVMRGYWNKPDATAETLRDGWFHSGDLGYKDPDGQFHLVGRIKDMVRRGGENISAAEVEGVLAEHAGVKMACVVPVPDAVRGEEVKAYVVLRDGVTRATCPPQDIVAFARSKLAAFKVPRYLEYVAELPMTPSERVEKHKLLKAKPDLRSGSFDAATGQWLA